MQIQEEILKNQLKTLFVHSPGSTAASVQIWFRAGSALEKKEDQGIAHFLEHMFFKGTPKRPGAKIAEEIEAYGGEVNAFTSFDYTCYYINTPNNWLLKSTEILMDMVANPLFSAADFAPEREVVLEEYKRSLDNPGQYGFFQVQKGCFNGTYSHPILGNEKTIKQFNKRQLQRFRKEFYNLSNAMLLVSGDLSNKSSLIKTIEKYRLPKGPKSEFPKFKLKPKTHNSAHNREVRQVAIQLVIQAPNMERDRAAAEDLAINCLCHGESSQLYKELVLKDSLASMVSGSTLFFADGGVHLIKVVCPEKNTLKVAERLSETCHKIFESGFKEKDVEKIKNQYLSSKIYEKESLESYAFSLGHSYAQSGDITCDDRLIERVNLCPSDQVNHALVDIFSKPIHAVIQVPEGEELAEYKELSKQIGDMLKPKNYTPPKTEKLKTKKSKNDPQVQIYQIAKGIKLLHRHNTMTPTFVVQSYIKGGITEETPATNGSYNLLAGTITKGYDGIDYDEIKSELEFHSSSLGGFSGKNAYGLTLHGQTRDLDTLLDHYFGTFFRPDFPEERLDHERELCLRALENQKEDPTRILFKEFSKQIFGDHPYSLATLGSTESLPNITREDIKAIHQRNLNEKEILFCYCGDLELKEVVNRFSHHISHLKDREKLIQYQDAKLPRKFSDAPTQISLDREQTHVFMGKIGFPLKSKENLYLKLLTTMLSGQSSELFVEARDRQGLCYTVQPVLFNALEAGYWGIYIATSNEKREQAVDLIKTLMGKYREKGITKRQFETLKKMIEGQNQLSLQTNDDYANTYCVPELQGMGFENVFKLQKQIENCKLEHFNKFLKSFLKDQWIHVEVGRFN